MSLLESAQIFFYISVSTCVVIISLIYIIKTIVIIYIKDIVTTQVETEI